MIMYTSSPLLYYTADSVICTALLAKINVVILQSDPFNRSHLTADMLIPDNELKARIQEFIRSQESKRGESLSMQSDKATIQTTSSEMLID